MIERWESLKDVHKLTKKPWNDAQRGMALDLCGIRVEFREVNDLQIQTLESQAELAASEIARLQRLQSMVLNELDDMERDTASQGLSDGGPVVWRLRRYQQASDRRFHRALRYLMATRSGSKDAKAESPKQAKSTGPKVANPLEEPSRDLGEVLAEMRAKMVAVPEPAKPTEAVKPVGAGSQSALRFRSRSRSRR